MQSYALYHTLNKKVKKCDLDPSQKKALMDHLNLLSPQHAEVVMMLIYEHYRVNSDIKLDLSKIDLPYGGKQRSKGVQFDICRIPVELQWILYKFLVLIQKKTLSEKGST